MSAPIQLLITFDGNTVNVQGPITNKVLCYGLLESAKASITAFDPDAQSPIIAAPGVLANEQRTVTP